MIDPAKLKPYFRNPRNNDKTVIALTKVIKRIGFNVPIVVDKDMVIIKGHSRWNASRILDLKEVPVIISSADEESNNKNRILDNAVHDLTEWDMEMLEIELDKTELDLASYKKLKWVAKILNGVKDTSIGEVIVEIPCPSCNEKLTYTKKELLDS